MKLGLVTYNLAADWDLATLLARCGETGFGGVELRTTHGHGVEPDLAPARRREVRQACADAGVVLWGLGTTCEFHSPEAAVVREQIELGKRFVELAADTGAVGVKVRPNGLLDDEAPEATCDRVGAALAELGPAAADAGVQVFLEVHGRGTSDPRWIRRILDAAGHPCVGACWNSNPHPAEVVDGSVSAAFELLRGRITSVHINELWRADYPYRELFALLGGSGYDGFTLAEIAANDDPVRLMHYYRALWSALQPA